MAKRGAPIGNVNAAKGRLWDAALRHELGRDRARLYRIADRVLEAAEKGEPWAVTEVRNTLDGKPKEHVQIDQNVTVNVGESESLEAAIRKRDPRAPRPTVQ